MSSTSMSFFLLILVFFTISHTVTCFNIKKYSIYNKDCVFSNIIQNKCVLIDPKRNIALCDNKFVVLFYDEIQRRFQNCRPCVAEKNKFLDPENYGDSFINVLTPGHIFFSGSVTVNGSQYDGIYEIELEADETVTVNNKTYNYYEDNRIRKSLSPVDISNIPVPKQPAQNNHALYTSVIILKVILICLIRCCCCRKKCCSSDQSETVIDDGPLIRENVIIIIPAGRNIMN